MGVAVEGLTLDIEVGSTVGSIEGKADGTVCLLYTSDAADE